jgi:nucleoside-diphosphate-sugar epimerase
VNVFLTGGTGLLGRHVIKHLSADGARVVALARDDAGESAIRALGAVPLRGRAEDPRTWERVLPCRVIVHAAALIAARAPWPVFYQANVEGTRLAATTARRIGARLVHVSSVAVYGRRAYDVEALGIGERFPFGPLEDHDFYARSKRLAEEVVREEADRGLEAVILRPCVIYGPGDRLFLPRLAAVARHGWLPLVGNRNAPLALVHARNVAAGVVAAALLPRAADRVYNLTNDDEITPRDFVAAIGEGIGRRIRTVRVPEAAAMAAARLVAAGLRVVGPGLYPGTLTGAVRFWRGGNPYRSNAARADLGWHPLIRHAEGVREAARDTLEPRPVEP